jgi:hypothetical protein
MSQDRMEERMATFNEKRLNDFSRVINEIFRYFDQWGKSGHRDLQAAIPSLMTNPSVPPRNELRERVREVKNNVLLALHKVEEKKLLDLDDD